MKNTLLALTFISLTGCTVYVPMQSSMPLLERQGQLEVAASMNPSVLVETVGAYSPLPHVVVTGAGKVGLNTGGGHYIRNRQGELGMGGYWNIGENWLLNATAGGGYATTNRQDSFLGGGHMQGQYSKLFGQIGAACELPFSTYSLTYRVDHASFSKLMSSGQPVSNIDNYRHQLVLNNRRRLGQNESWYLQSSIGLSSSNLDSPDYSNQNETLDDQWSTTGIPAVILSIGVVWQPQWPLQ
ncbi:hypothetical protein [Hymenobacter volaticus]|uniref:DUF3575 domain-containing protein n=1 Tax=Hymenobacter volaticus TaxID=2932254 RepID=A0ABY4G8V5_9BACT|nr:hypothetical protein [Hymenobacter volaticus]UOQ67009.1 hypothetical protein MUN86_03625 [Hymenobacter volaticus]